MKKKKDYVKATSEGRLYIETEDFFKQPKIIKQIKKLMESKTVKRLMKNNDETIVGKSEDVILGKGIDELGDIIVKDIDLV